MLLWKEWREIRLRVAAALVLAGAVVASWFRAYLTWGRSYELENLLDSGIETALWFGLGLCGFALWLGYDTVAGETGDQTWRFLCTRAVSPLKLMLHKVLFRAIVVLGAWAAAVGLVWLTIWLSPMGGNMDSLHIWPFIAWTLRQPPYPFAYAAIWVLVQAYITFATACLVSTFCARRGVALCASAIGAFLVCGAELALMPQLLTNLLKWQGAATEVAAVSGLAVLLFGLAFVRTARARTPGIIVERRLRVVS